MTNLFFEPRPVEVSGKFFEEGLIHRTIHGEFVRSKSEVVIANILHGMKIDYEYEKELRIDGESRFPDFTIEDSESGRIFYWEHCGMLGVPEYKRRWQRKLEWYRARGILPHEQGGGERGTLIVTEDDRHGGIDSARISQLVQQLIGGC